MDLAENEDGFSDIFGTANLTSKGSGRTGGQPNQVRVNKITGYFADSARYKKLNDEFNKWYFEKSEPYLDELVNLLEKDREEGNEIEIVERWISYTDLLTQWTLERSMH